MDVITEKSTDEMDLPHDYRSDSAQPQSDCRCGREKAHRLHGDPALIEKAAADVPVLVTEKGV